MDRDRPVAIIGGGVSGLSTAYELHKRRIPFLLFESADRVGGVIQTEFVDGFTIDGGPDSLLIQKPSALELCAELGLGDRLVSTLPPRTAYVFKAGRLHPLPEASVLGIPTRFRPLATTPLLSTAGKIRMAMELAIPPAASNEKDESIGSFFRRRFGDESVAYLAEPLLAGIHAGDVERLSMRALFPKLVDAEQEYGSVIKRLRSLRRAAGQPKDGLFKSLPGGISELTSALVGTLETSSLRTGQDVARISGPSPLTIHTTSGETVHAREIIVTTPAYVTAKLVRDLDPELETLCRSIPYRSTATVVLSYPRCSVAHHLNGTGFVVPRVESALSLMAGSWVSSKWPGRAPEGQVLLKGFVGGTRDAHALEQSDAELVAASHRDFSQLLGISDDPMINRVYRWPRLNPQYEVGHLEKLAKIDARLVNIPGLHIIGAGFRGIGIPDCVTQGRTTAAVVVERMGS
jgi:oxygen-dependent protoporphyrinogen oxidase